MDVGIWAASWSIHADRSPSRHRSDRIVDNLRYGRGTGNARAPRQIAIGAALRPAQQLRRRRNDTADALDASSHRSGIRNDCPRDRRTTMMKHLVHAAAIAVVLALAVAIGLAVTIGSAVLGHEILVLIYGEDLSDIDGTLPMITAVLGSYLVGVVAGVVALVVGWRRFVRGSRPSTGSNKRGTDLDIMR
jgi:hypothetical protein